mgnify:CR=1 FL=1
MIITINHNLFQLPCFKGAKITEKTYNTHNLLFIKDLKCKFYSI